MLGVQQSHEPHCCVNEHIHYIPETVAVPQVKKSHGHHNHPHHRVSCIAKKCDKATNHMGEVIYVMSRLHAQVQSLKSLFLGVLHQIDQEENQYRSQPSYSEITHKLRHATSPGERARIKVEARRQRLAARRMCFRQREPSADELDTSDFSLNTPRSKLQQEHVQQMDSPVRQIERYGDDNCIIEYDDMLPPSGPSTPQLVVSDDMVSKRSRHRQDSPRQHHDHYHSRADRKSNYTSAVSRMGNDKHEETSVWATLVNELTREWKNSGTPVTLLRYAHMSRQGQKARSTSGGFNRTRETHHVTLSEISKITSVADKTARIPQFSASDIHGPLHSTMIDIGDLPGQEEFSDDLFAARNYTVHSVDTESTASSMDLREMDSKAEYSTGSYGLQGKSASFDSFLDSDPHHAQRYGNCSPVPNSRHEIIGASYIEDNMKNKGEPHFSMEATCASAPDCVNLTVPDNITTRSSRSSMYERSSSYSAVQSSYKESDLNSSDSSIHESDLEILRPKFKKPVGRPKRRQRKHIHIASDTDESHNNVSVPLNTPDLTGSSNASKPSRDFIINNTKSAENIVDFGPIQNNLSPPQNSIMDHTRPACIGKLNTPVYQPIIVKNRLFSNILSDTDSGIGERPKCIGSSETPLNINVRGRFLTYDSSDENDTEDDGVIIPVNNNSFILGDRPACLGKSMMEINQYLPKSRHQRPNSIDVDSGVSMSALSPVVHLKNRKEPIPVTKHSSSQAKTRLHIGCVSSRADQTSEFSEEIEVLESHLATKPNKKSFSKKLKNFGGIFNRNKKEVKS